MKRNLLVFCLLISLTLAIQAKNINVWMVGTSNEKLQLINQIISESFTPQTGIKPIITALPWAESEVRFQLAAASGDAPDAALMSGLLAAELGVRGE